MPFLVTTKPGCDCGYCADPDAHRRPCSSRRWGVRAVATLEEAQKTTALTVGQAGGRCSDWGVFYRAALLACDGDWQWPALPRTALVDQPAARPPVDRRTTRTTRRPARHGAEVLARVQREAGRVMAVAFWIAAVGPLPDETVIEVEPTTYVHPRPTARAPGSTWTWTSFALRARSGTTWAAGGRRNA